MGHLPFRRSVVLAHRGLCSDGRSGATLCAPFESRYRAVDGLEALWRWRSLPDRHRHLQDVTVVQTEAWSTRIEDVGVGQVTTAARRIGENKESPARRPRTLCGLILDVFGRS